MNPLINALKEKRIIVVSCSDIEFIFTVVPFIVQSERIGSYVNVEVIYPRVGKKNYLGIQIFDNKKGQLGNELDELFEEVDTSMLAVISKLKTLRRKKNLLPSVVTSINIVGG